MPLQDSVLRLVAVLDGGDGLEPLGLGAGHCQLRGINCPINIYPSSAASAPQRHGQYVLRSHISSLSTRLAPSQDGCAMKHLILSGREGRRKGSSSQV